MKRLVPLEPQAEKVCNEASKPPLIFQLPPEKGREVLEKMQDSPVYKYPAEIKRLQFESDNWGTFKIYFVIPSNLQGIPSVIYYIHGAGWVFGSFHTHEKLIKELAYRTNSVVIFPEYTRSPEVKFPVAIEQCYSILNQIPMVLSCNNIKANLDNLTVAGDSVGGNMAIAMAIMSKFENGPKINKLLLYYPVTDDNFNTDSYNEFANGYYLYKEGMEWFWQQYAPDKEKRNNILATPLKASLEQLSNLPNTMILNGEVDVLRDEGEAFANKLREAGNNVTAIRFQGMIHDFVMLNSLDNSNACRAAMNVSCCWINCNN